MRYILFFLVFHLAHSFCMQAPIPSISTWEAARRGDLKTLEQLITAHPQWIDSRERKKKKDDPTEFEEGITPLAWAVLQRNKKVPAETYLNMVKFLVEHKANVNFKDNNGQTILHMAVHGGNPHIIHYLLQHGAKKSINMVTQEKGRTPLQDAIRSSKDAIIHLAIEKQNFNSLATLKQSLDDAIAQLKQKESEKLSTNTIVNIIAILKDYGAATNPIDEMGHPPAYYVNEVLLISEPDIIKLLHALNAPKTRIIQYDEKDIYQAITILEKLATGLTQFGLSPQFHNVIYAIQAAQQEQNTEKKFNILRIAMAFLSHAKEIVKEAVKNDDQFKKLEEFINKVRTILRDCALLVSGRIPRSSLQKSEKPQAPAEPSAKIIPASTLPISPALTEQIKKAIEKGDYNTAFALLKNVDKIPHTLMQIKDNLTGKTLLLEAASRGDEEMLAKLLLSRANINIQVAGGWTALLEAINANQIKAAHFLLAHGANPHLATEDYGNAINLAVHKGNTDLVEKLLKQGVDPNIWPDIGTYPLGFARKNNRPDLVKLLKEYGAKERP